MKKLALCAVALLAFAGTAVAGPQKAGKWQVKMQMEMPGMPVKMPPITHTVCLTEEDVNNPQKAVPSDPKSDCKVGDYKVDGNKVTWTMECPKQKMKGSGEIVYTDDSYTGGMQMTMGEQEMSMKYEGKLLGACQK